MNDQKIVAIIPARGGSKGIPRKNMRMMGEKPLISYIIETAKKSKYINKIVVTTEDEEISERSKMHNVEVINRPEELASDDVPLDPVIYHALTNLEKNKGDRYDYVITLQPTSPLLSAESIDKAIKLILNKNYDTLISVKDETHLYWTIRDKQFFPLHEKRENRQYLNPIYKENGAILISKREIITRDSRIGNNIYIFQIPEKENIDIDNYQDWWIAENILKRQTIMLRVDGDNKLGLGHVYRMITLANRMGIYHNVIFLMDKNRTLGIRKVRENNHKIITFDNDMDLLKKIEQTNPSIVINDILDTEKKYILELKKRGYFVVSFEDLGEGSELSNIVINALYENTYPPKNHYFGYKYECLRDDVYYSPQKQVKKDVKRILITFGGTDPNDLTSRTLRALEKINSKDIYIDVVLGLGYKSRKELYNYAKILKDSGLKIEINENIKNMAERILKADIVITSNGRTIYEVVGIGTPCISISHNERETRHLFVQNSRSIKYLGFVFDISEDDITNAIKKLIEDYELRKKMNKNSLKFDLKRGVDRVLKLIIDNYYDWVRENEKNQENSNKV